MEHALSIVYVGDEHHRYFQEHHVETLKQRTDALEVIYWSTVGFEFFRQLDELASQEKLFLIGSRHGAIPAVQWVARNPGRAQRLILLHPSLHLNVPGLEAPTPHFVTTTVICHSRVASPDYEQISTLAGKFFLDYSIHLTPEPAELTSTLTLLSLPDEGADPGENKS